MGTRFTHKTFCFVLNVTVKSLRCWLMERVPSLGVLIERIGTRQEPADNKLDIWIRTYQDIEGN